MITAEQLKQAAHDVFNDKVESGWSLKVYEYRDEKNNVLFGRVRLDPPAGSSEGKSIRPLSHNGEDWVVAEPTFPEGKPLYNLFDVSRFQDATVWVVEGEKCVDALKGIGLVATTSGSASSAGRANWQPLAGRDIVVWPDNDEPGFKYAREVTEILLALGCTVKWVEVEDA